jgi:hypothetical protein
LEAETQQKVSVEGSVDTGDDGGQRRAGRQMPGSAATASCRRPVAKRIAREFSSAGRRYG